MNKNFILLLICVSLILSSCGSSSPEPWIISYTDSQGETTSVWKGAVYWTEEQGLPPRNDGEAVQAAAGDTTDEAIMAYRIGTVINIVNGGVECNAATWYPGAWHPGPMQRISYYNAYAMYFNDQISGLNATRVAAATNVWDQNVGANSADNLKTSSCYAQKSYYSW